MSKMFLAALVGGAVTGVLGSIPFVNFGCCLWAGLGGFLAVLMFTRSEKDIDMGKGALVGFLSGLVGAVIASILNAILSLLNLGVQTAMMGSQGMMGAGMPMDGAMIGATGGLTILGMLLGFVFGVIIYGIFGVLGGIIGAATLKK
ncbi:hypothetical protein ACFLZN_01720 [Nanoarchaeota archaeon]